MTDARHAHGQAELCLNCGTRLIGAHCHGCGQSGHVHRTVGAIGQEIAHGVFHLEGRIWRTLPMLVLHRGALTWRYIAGERARSNPALVAYKVQSSAYKFSWALILLSTRSSRCCSHGGGSTCTTMQSSRPIRSRSCRC